MSKVSATIDIDCGDIKVERKIYGNFVSSSSRKSKKLLSQRRLLRKSEKVVGCTYSRKIQKKSKSTMQFIFLLLFLCASPVHSVSTV